MYRSICRGPIVTTSHRDACPLRSRTARRRRCSAPAPASTRRRGPRHDQERERRAQPHAPIVTEGRARVAGAGDPAWTGRAWPRPGAVRPPATSLDPYRSSSIDSGRPWRARDRSCCAARPPRCGAPAAPRSTSRPGHSVGVKFLTSDHDFPTKSDLLNEAAAEDTTAMVTALKEGRDQRVVPSDCWFWSICSSARRAR